MNLPLRLRRMARPVANAAWCGGATKTSVWPLKSKSRLKGRVWPPEKRLSALSAFTHNQADQIRSVSGAELFHNPGAMYFDGSGADSELPGDFLVGGPIHET